MSKQWTVAQKEKRAAMSQLLGLMKGDILDAYRRGIEYGEEPPVVELRITDDFDRHQGSGLTVKTINPSECGDRVEPSMPHPLAALVLFFR